MPAEAPDHPAERLRLILLVNLSPGSMPDKPNRAWKDQLRDKMDDLAQYPAIGGQIFNVWWTAGPHDLVIHLEVKDAPAAHAFSLTLSRKLKADVVTLIAIADADVGSTFDVLNIKNGP